MVRALILLLSSLSLLRKGKDDASDFDYTGQREAIL
jgi:hypothetical protein